MSTIKSSNEDITINADGSGRSVKFQANGVEKASISSAGAFTSTSIDATKLSGTVPNFTSTGIDDNATSTAITIDASENVGIGVTPEAWGSGSTALQIGATSAVSAFSDQLDLSENAYWLAGGSSYRYTTTSHASSISLTNGNHVFRVAPSGTADTAISWKTALTIKNDGSTEQVSPTGSTALSVLYNNNNVIGDWVQYMKLGANGYNTTSYFQQFWNGVSGTCFLVLGNGNVQNLNNSYAGTSDLKLKENIIDASSQWEDIKALQIKKYSLKVDKRTTPNQLGVIAQELEASGMGGLVSEAADTEEVLDADWIASEGETEDDRPTKHVDLGTTTKSVKYSVLYMKAVKALQEAITKIEALEARVTALEV